MLPYITVIELHVFTLWLKVQCEAWLRTFPIPRSKVRNCCPGLSSERHCGSVGGLIYSYCPTSREWLLPQLLENAPRGMRTLKVMNHFEPQREAETPRSRVGRGHESTPTPSPVDFCLCSVSYYCNTEPSLKLSSSPIHQSSVVRPCTGSTDTETHACGDLLYYVGLEAARPKPPPNKST